MIKVKEFLDRNFKSLSESSWVYKRSDLFISGNMILKSESLIQFNSSYLNSFIQSLKIECHCNNETLKVTISENGKLESRVFQTYSHLKNIKDHAYYRTEEYIIGYLNSFIVPFQREEKILTILK